MIRYLLGELPETERIAVEERFFSDEESFQQMLALEDELMYDYLNGELSPADRKSFERRFVASPEGAKRAQFAGALLGSLNLAESQRRERLRWRMPPIPIGWAAAAAALVIVAVWTARDLGRLRTEVQVEREARVQLERQLAARSAPPVLASFVLSPGLMRGGSEIKRLRIPGGTDLVEFHLELKNADAYNSYRVTLRTLDAKEVWSQEGLRASGHELNVRISARLVDPEDYELTLQGIAPAGGARDAGDYYFSVVR